MIRLTRSLLAGLILSTVAQAGVLKTVLINRDGNPVADAKVFVDCRQNFFFSDSNGVAMAYIDSSVVDCIATVSHPEYITRSRLIPIAASSDTAECSIVLTANGEPEPVGPGPMGNRFGSIVSCCGLIDCRIIPDNGFGSGLLRLVVANPPSCDSSACMVIAMSSDERAVDGLESGYDLVSVERISFDAKSSDSSVEVRFFSLSDVCDPCESACPGIEAKLSPGFSRHEIDITRWDRENAVAVLGLSVRSRLDHPVTVEIRDLRLIYGVPDRVQDR